MLFDSDKFPKDLRTVLDKMSEIENLLRLEPTEKEKNILTDKLDELAEKETELERRYIGSFRDRIAPLKEQLEKMKEGIEPEPVEASIKEFDNYIERAKNKGINVVFAKWIFKILDQYPGFRKDVETTKKLVSETLEMFDAAGFEIKDRQELEELAKSLQPV